jgi:hypothetical protein
MRLHPRVGGSPARPGRNGDRLGLTDLQIAGDDEQDIRTSAGQRSPYLRVLKSHSPRDRAGGQFVGCHFRRHRQHRGSDIGAPVRPGRAARPVDRRYDSRVHADARMSVMRAGCTISAVAY